MKKRMNEDGFTLIEMMIILNLFRRKERYHSALGGLEESYWLGKPQKDHIYFRFR